MRFDLADLSLFRHVAEAGSITHGAERVYLALAAASTRIRNMEEVLGAPLLVRARHGITPTQAGRTLLQHARIMLEQSERLREDLGAYAGGLAGQVRVLSNTNALTEFLPETLSSFLAAHPNVSVDLEEKLSDEIVGLIAEGVGDIGIVAGTVDAGRLTTYPFRTDRFVLVVARTHPLAKLSKIDFADTLDHDFVGLDRSSAAQRFFADKARASAARCGSGCSCAASTPGAGWWNARSALASFRRPRRRATSRPWRSRWSISTIPGRCATSRSAFATSRRCRPMRASSSSICGHRSINRTAAWNWNPPGKFVLAGHPATEKPPCVLRNC